MKRTKPLLTLEELWDLEDKHPLVDASTGGLLRWMYATGMFTAPSAEPHMRSKRNAASLRQSKSGGR